MNISKKYCSLFIGLSLLTGCASGPTALEQALAIPADTTSSISINELLDRAIVQDSKSAPSTKAIEPSRDQTLLIARAANEEHHSSPFALVPEIDALLLLTFINDRSNLTSRHQQQLQRFAQRNKKANGPSQHRIRLPVRINCAPSSQSNPYIAASTAMLRCLNVSRFLEKTIPNPAISLAPSLPVNQIQISQ